jgi:hypothetical protein
MEMGRSLMEVERNRQRARQIELADEAGYHRVKDDQMARMTAFNGQMLQALVNRPQTLPAAVAPSMISNVTNVQNITPTSYFENVQNIYQTTHNLHQNSLNFINNTSVRMMNMFGLHTPGDRSEGTPLLNIVNGGPPPPPPSPGASRIALQDGNVYAPDTPIDVAPLPAPMGPDAPLAIRDRKPKPIKKPPLKPPIQIDPIKVKPPIILVDPPPRKKPRKADEILRILDGITDSEPKRVKKLLATLPVPTRNRLRIVPA